MLDTIVIKVKDKNKFHVSHPEFFTPEFSKRNFPDLSSTERISKNRSVKYLSKFVLHKISSDSYLPRIEIYENLDTETQAVLYTLRIEYSIPKILYGNNILEIKALDYPLVQEKLLLKLQELGIDISAQSLAMAEVSVIHFAKNIVLPSHDGVQEITNELSLVDMGKAVDINSIRLKNGGTAVQMYCGSYELVFYNKIKDILSHCNLSVDKQYSDSEYLFIHEHNLQNVEICRFEYRLKKPQILKSIINKILNKPHTTPIYFNEVFSKELWKAVLLNVWKKLIDRPTNQLALLQPQSPQSLLTHLVKQIRKEKKSPHGQNKVLMCFGLITAFQNLGVKGVENQLGLNWSKESSTDFKRFLDKVKYANNLTRGIPYADQILFLEKELNKFEPISLDVLKNYRKISS